MSNPSLFCGRLADTARAHQRLAEIVQRIIDRDPEAIHDKAKFQQQVFAEYEEVYGSLPPLLIAVLVEIFKKLLESL